MRPIADCANSPPKAGQGSAEAEACADVALRTAQIERIAAELAACEALADPELARRTGRTLLAVVACATEALLNDGGQALQAAPDKFGAFFDKAAAGFVQAIDGLAKRAALADVAAGNESAPGRPRAVDALPAFAPWRAARE